MMSRSRLIKLAVLLLILAPVGALLHRFLPQHDVLRLVGTEVRRIDLDGRPGGETRDVFYIYGETLDTKRPRVYRNEDTGWGLPPYFKFNSADLQAVAASIAAERGTAILTNYGWRINLFSMFPNVTGISRAPDGASPFPWFNVIFLLVLGGIVFLAVRSGSRLLGRRRA